MQADGVICIGSQIFDTHRNLKRHRKKIYQCLTTAFPSPHPRQRGTSVSVGRGVVS